MVELLLAVAGAVGVFAVIVTTLCVVVYGCAVLASRFRLVGRRHRR